MIYSLEKAPEEWRLGLIHQQRLDTKNHIKALTPFATAKPSKEWVIHFLREACSCESGNDKDKHLLIAAIISTASAADIEDFRSQLKEFISILYTRQCSSGIHKALTYVLCQDFGKTYHILQSDMQAEDFYLFRKFIEDGDPELSICTAKLACLANNQASSQGWAKSYLAFIRLYISDIFKNATGKTGGLIKDAAFICRRFTPSHKYMLERSQIEEIINSIAEKEDVILIFSAASLSAGLAFQATLFLRTCSAQLTRKHASSFCILMVHLN